ncbi:MAG TPA: histidine kinase dimerization/phospho-acceptor domain-containing protein, partial [bacterium]|nr:histidine kinase dimerization/phospho-acceptor domain-containing protein [bacterium]
MAARRETGAPESAPDSDGPDVVLPSAPGSSFLSALDRTPTLREMADRDALAELCERLRALLGLGVAIYDNEGTAVVAPPPIPAYCEARCQQYDETERCAATKANVGAPLADEDRQESRGCFTGLRYLALRLRSGVDVVGVAVLGPFDEADRARAGDMPERADEKARATLSVLREEIRRVDRAELARVAEFVTGSIELLLFAQLKSFLTSRVHLESVNDSFRELQSKNRELRASFEKLKALDVLKSNFLATVSHELRTPLTSIIGYGEMVLDGIGGKVPPGAKKQIELIVLKGEQLLQLINSVLDISKLESGRMELNPERIKLKELVDDALASVRPQAAKKKLVLSAKIGDEFPELIADRYKLRQVLVNLLGNAVKFTPEGGKVGIKSRR